MFPSQSLFTLLALSSGIYCTGGQSWFSGTHGARRRMRTGWSPEVTPPRSVEGGKGKRARIRFERGVNLPSFLSYFSSYPAIFSSP